METSENIYSSSFSVMHIRPELADTASDENIYKIV